MKIIVTPGAKMGYGVLIGRRRVIIIGECKDGCVVPAVEVDGSGGGALTVVSVVGVEKWTEHTALVLGKMACDSELSTFTACGLFERRVWIQ